MEDREGKPARRWWRKKRFLLPGLFLAYVAAAFAENAFVDYLIARQMEDHFDFDRRYAELLASDEYGSSALKKETKDWLGYTHTTYFWRLSPKYRSNTVKYIYLRPKLRLNPFDYIWYEAFSSKIAVVVARIVNGKIEKFDI